MKNGCQVAESLRILFIGDIVGRPGRRAIREILPRICKEHQPDFVVANGENAAGGLGITPDVAGKLLNSEIDVLTSGNHVWNKKEIYGYLNTNPRLIRPANYPGDPPGCGYGVFHTKSGIPVGIINLEGRIFMKNLECPFRTAKKIIRELKKEAKSIIIDFHAEATSEKQALGWFLDGEISALIGTHTHVPTADERILPNGTAYITDVGMTGSIDSVIGFQHEIVLERLLSQLPATFKVAKRNVHMQAVLVDINVSTGQAVSIARVEGKLSG